MSVTVQLGDSRALLAALDADSIDSAVTDPPYELGFMGRAWDSTGIAYDVELWREVYRVLKPGAYLAAFGGTRTYHRMAVAIEDAGFEIRDQLAWAYGSGFPKSLDVAKAIDKARGDNAQWKVVGKWLRLQREAAGISRNQIAQSLDGYKNLASAAADLSNWENGLSLPALKRWEFLRGQIGFSDEMDAEVSRLNGRKGTLGEAWERREIVGTIRNNEPGGTTSFAQGGIGAYQRGDTREREIRGGAVTNDAAQWQGWGTALKPAWEPICLARKPLSERTVAANVLRWGTGALNIDGCRIATDELTPRHNKPGEYVYDAGIHKRAVTIEPSPLGRFPANFVHDGSEEVLGAFPCSDGGGSISNRASPKTSGVYGAFAGEDERWSGYADTGSAARFFYSAKAGKLDRLGSDHPTVKPVDLMRWLERLVTPPGGTILDPFAGSGSTGVAAHIEGFDAVLMELREEAVADINRRLAYIKGEGRTTAIEAARLKSPKAARKARGGDTPLFAEPEA